MNKKENNNFKQNNKKYKNNNNNKTTIAGCDTIEINLVATYFVLVRFSEATIFRNLH